MDQDLIDLLNNFDRAAVGDFASHANDIFIKDGEPTDAFLDALRRDLDRDFGVCSESAVKAKAKAKKIKTPKTNKKAQPSKDAPKNKQDTIPISIGSLGNDQGVTSRGSSMEKAPVDVASPNSQTTATIRSLQLRLNGALKAIKQLQAELNASEERTDDQKQEIARLQARLKANAERHNNVRLENDQQQHVAFLVKEIDDLKVCLLLTVFVVVSWIIVHFPLAEASCIHGVETRRGNCRTTQMGGAMSQLEVLCREKPGKLSNTFCVMLLLNRYPPNSKSFRLWRVHRTRRKKRSLRRPISVCC